MFAWGIGVEIFTFRVKPKSDVWKTKKGTNPGLPFHFQKKRAPVPTVSPLSRTHSSSLPATTLACGSLTWRHATNQTTRVRNGRRSARQREGKANRAPSSGSSPSRFRPRFRQKKKNNNEEKQSQPTEWKGILESGSKGGRLARIRLSKYQSSIRVSPAHLCRGLKCGDGEVATGMESDGSWNHSTCVGERRPKSLLNMSFNFHFPVEGRRWGWVNDFKWISKLHRRRWAD